MYDYLEGRRVSRGAARLVLDVGGIGYDLAVPLAARFPERDPLRVWTHFVVREDSHALYGFPDRASRDLFRLVLSARGVGPALALGLLSSFSPEALIATLVEEDLPRLVRVKGVGRKTAEQMLLDLRDKALALSGAAAAELEGGPRSSASAASANVEDAVTALVSVGFREKEARQSVERAAQEVDAADLEALVRAALAAR